MYVFEEGNYYFNLRSNFFDIPGGISSKKMLLELFAASLKSAFDAFANCLGIVTDIFLTRTFKRNFGANNRDENSNAISFWIDLVRLPVDASICHLRHNVVASLSARRSQESLIQFFTPEIAQINLQREVFHALPRRATGYD
jgi:hypothetical protein